MISRYTVEVEDGFEILKAAEEYEILEAKIERHITQSLFWKMLYTAISSGNSKGHILDDVGPDATTAYVKGVGFLNLKRHGFCIPTPGVTSDPKKKFIRLWIKVTWADRDEEYGHDRSHMIDVPCELIDKGTKSKINGWFRSQRSYVKKRNDESAKSDVDELLRSNPEIVRHLRKKLAENEV